MGARILFITGTDTGVGKTLLTALLLSHLRARGARALALKPFCSGGRDDAQLLFDLQQGDLTLEEINPFYFPEPVAPLISARKHRRLISLDQVAQHINSIVSHLGRMTSANFKKASKKSEPMGSFGLGPAIPSSAIKNPNLKNQDFLLIEGSGGLFVPLGEGFSVCDLIAHLDCEVLVASRNRLGTINHTLLTVQALENRYYPCASRTLITQNDNKQYITRSSTDRIIKEKTHLSPAPGTPRSPIKVVFMGTSAPDFSSASNRAILSELLSPIPLVSVPYLGSVLSQISAINRIARKQKALLTRILA